MPMQPDMIASAIHALHLLLEPARLLVLFLGVLIGLAIGVLPGLNGIVGMAMLIPFTYNLDEFTAFALLLGMAAVITSSDFITAVLFGVPGHVGAAATVIDGHAMAKKGEAGRAFGAGFASSLAGGVVGAIVLAVSIPILRPIMLSIGSPELLAFTLFGLSMVATLSGRAPLKGLTAAGLGLMIAMVGSRSQSGTLRWTFGWLYLWDGVPLIPATLGLFALPELAELAITRKRIAGDNAPNINLSSQWEGVRDVGRHWWLVLRCGVLGVGLGAIPGIGSAVIDWIAYGYAQRTEKNAETFGTGDVRGVIAPESSNNSKEGGHLVPTIAFGVPAGASMAILLGAFLMHGLTPGPEMLTKHLDLTYLIVWSLTLAHVMGAIICLACSRWLAQISRVPPEILLPIIVALVFVAAFEGEHDWGDLYSLVVFGILGWIMKRLGWPRPPMVLGLVVGAIFERYLFISTQLYGWGWLVRWPVMAILGCVAWALYRPLSQIVKTLIEQLREVKSLWPRFGAAPAFSVAVIVLIVAAILSSAGWPHDAKIVPLTACGMALTAAVLNLINELFGREEAVVAHADATVKVSAHVDDLGLADDVVRARAVMFFAWMAVFIACVWLIGFIPAIALFVFAYMCFGFGEPWPAALGYAAATTSVCYVVFQWALQVAWPPSLLGDLFPALRAATRLI
ncbi:MAG TPA: tripartite tricarboxylate transporter permease [Xanthobacteraceae bacterium]|jgi:TctA family transporter|nr:tripartite tricarboxylate transporter permease [Xanthobacteraceae bacterium]